MKQGGVYGIQGKYLVKAVIINAEEFGEEEANGNAGHERNYSAKYNNKEIFTKRLILHLCTTPLSRDLNAAYLTAILLSSCHIG